MRRTSRGRWRHGRRPSRCACSRSTVLSPRCREPSRPHRCRRPREPAQHEPSVPASTPTKDRRSVVPRLGWAVRPIFRCESPAPSRASSDPAVACAASMAASGRSGIRLELQGEGAASVETGLPVLDHLLERLADYAGWDLVLEVEPGTGEAEVAQAGTALGTALHETLRAARGYGFASMTSAEALAS